MASRKKIDGSSRSTSKNVRWLGTDRMSSSSSSADEADQLSARRDKNVTQDHFNKNRIVENDQQTGQDVSRREENPFSFKHFLRNESQTNYYKTGARPKIYSSSATSPNNLEKDTGVYSRNPTELPDFVQDHLIVEQCYLNYVPEQQSIPDVDNLPDFALNSIKRRQSQRRNDSQKNQSQLLADIPFNFTGLWDNDIPQNNHATPNEACSNNLNLPIFDTVDNSVDSKKRSDSVGFPFDLPLPLAELESSNNVVTRDCTPTTDSNVPKSLPDFLNDGPIHNRNNLSNDVGPNSQSDMAESAERRLLLENDRLRQELDIARRQINEKSIRIQLLETELASKREVDHEETVHLEKAVEQVEDNLKRSTKRALNAENTVTSLKKEIKTLKASISLLQLENSELKSAVDAANGLSSGNRDKTVQKLAGELRNAASTAEISLRQLMCGVDNLRVLASTLENINRIEERTENFLPDFDAENNAAGPAL